MVDVKPNFFIVGAAKSGTTSLYHYLNIHPQIGMSPIKEPHHFSTDIIFDDFSERYRRNTAIDCGEYLSQPILEERHIAYIDDRNAYLQLYRDLGQYGYRAIGEASTGYLFSSQAAKNIRQYDEKSKIIVMLRNPIERAYSHFLMDLRRGFSPSKYFVDSIKRDMNSGNKGWGVSQLYIELSSYSIQLTRFFENFPRENICILFMDDFSNNTIKVVKDVYKFLDVDPNVSIDLMSCRNKAKVPRLGFLHDIVVKHNIDKKIKKMINSKTRGKLKSFIYKKKHKEKISPEDEVFLLSLFNSEIEKVEFLLGRDLSEWKVIPPCLIQN